jgi:hypothetical protein
MSHFRVIYPKLERHQKSERHRTQEIDAHVTRVEVCRRHRLLGGFSFLCTGIVVKEITVHVISLAVASDWV